jgi:sugar phosphate isomerase/epimerase
MRDLADHLQMCAVNTATLGFQTPIRETVDAIARAGFGGIALWRREIEGQDLAVVSKAIRDAKLKVTGYCRSTFLAAETHEQFEASIADNKRALSEASALGSDVLVLVVGSLSDLTAARRMVIDGIGALMEHAAKDGVKLALEPLHPVYAADRSCVTTAAQALDICDQLEPSGMRQLGVLLDVYHIWWDPDVMRQIKRAGAANRILGFHVNDWLLDTRDPLNDRGMMGDGVIDIKGLRRAVEAAGYNGFVEVEIFSKDDWWKRPIDETLETIRARMISVV